MEDKNKQHLEEYIIHLENLSNSLAEFINSVKEYSGDYDKIHFLFGIGLREFEKFLAVTEAMIIKTEEDIKMLS